MIRKSISCTKCKNSNCLIKKNCPPHLLKNIDNNKVSNLVKKRQTIFHEGNESYCIYFIHSGLVKVFKNGAFNKDQIVRFCIDGNILGHRGLIKSETYPVSAQTITDTQVCSFQKKFFFNLLQDVPQIAIKLMLFFADELHEEETKLRDMAVLNVREKVVKGLLLLINSFGLNENNEINCLPLLSRQDIADLVGLTPNQVTKEISHLKKEKIVDVYQKNIKIITKEKLQEIVSFLE